MNIHQGLKVFGACFLGAAIGALVALEMATMFWWVGLLAGFLVGYLTYEFKAVIVAGRRAGRQVIGYRPDWQKWQLIGKAIPIYALLLVKALLIVCMLSITVVAVSLAPFLLVELLLRDIIAITIMFGCVCTFIVFLTIMASFISYTECLSTGNIIQAEELITIDRNIFSGDFFKYLFYVTPIYVFFIFLPQQIFQVCRWLIRVAPVAFKAIGRFCRLVLVEIHSDSRLLCGVDAAIGAAIGYFSGSVIVGAVIGGLFGLANYELVSKRLLGLVPRQS